MIGKHVKIGTHIPPREETTERMRTTIRNAVSTPVWWMFTCPFISAGAASWTGLPFVCIVSFLGLMLAGIAGYYMSGEILARERLTYPVLHEAVGSRLSPLAWGGVWAVGIVIFCLTVPLWLPEYVAATPGPGGWIMVVTMMSTGVVGMPFLFLRSRDFGFVAAVWAIVAVTVLLVLCAWSGRGTEASAEETVIYSVFPALIGFYWVYQLRQALDGWGAIEELERLRVGLARQAIDGERVRMARDLHDEVGHALAAVGLHAELARRHLDEGRTGDAVAALTQVEEAARITQRRVNRLVRGYRSRDLAAEIESSSLLLRTKGIEVATSLEETDMPGPVARTLAWVVREATTNIMRHSDATSVSIGLTLDGDVTLCITNDRPKAPVATSGGGHGLAGLRERLGDVGGHFETTFEPGTFTLLARVPREALQRLSAVETCDTDTDESGHVCH